MVTDQHSQTRPFRLTSPNTIIRRTARYGTAGNSSVCNGNTPGRYKMSHNFDSIFNVLELRTNGGEHVVLNEMTGQITIEVLYK